MKTPHRGHFNDCFITNSKRVIDCLQSRLEDALEGLRNSLVEFDQPEVLDAIAELDQEISSAIRHARQEGTF